MLNLPLAGSETHYPDAAGNPDCSDTSLVEMLKENVKKLRAFPADISGVRFESF